MNLEDFVENSVRSYCQDRGYSDRLTKLMVALVRKIRNNELEPGDLGEYLQRVHNLAEKEGLA